MDKRMYRILDMFSNGQYYTAEKIAEQLNISTKTVRNLLKEINREIEASGALIRSKYGVGYYLEVSKLPYQIPPCQNEISPKTVTSTAVISPPPIPAMPDISPASPVPADEIPTLPISAGYIFFSVSP